MKKEGVTAKSDKSPANKKPPKKLPIEEKLKLLDDVDKAYIRGYIDRALAEQKRKSRAMLGKKKENKGD